MATTRLLRARWRVAILLFAAFLVVGVASSVAILTITFQRYHSDLRAELLSVAKLAALQVDPEAHEQLNRPEQMEEKSYRDQLRRLADAQARATGIRFIYTLRRVNGQYHFVLDPTPPGDSDADGIEDKSYLMDPYPEITATARRVFDTGIAEVDPDFTQDRWGTFLSAYAPVYSRTGRVVAILGVDRDASAIQEHFARVREAAWWGLAIVVALGLMFSFGMVQQILASTPGSLTMTKRSAFRFAARTMVLEMLLAGATITVLLAGATSLVLQAQNRKLASDVESRMTSLQAVGTKVSRRMLDANGGRDLAQQLHDQWRALALPGRPPEDLAAKEDVPESRVHRALREGLVRINEEVNRLRGKQSEYNASFEQKDQLMNVIFAVAALLSIGALGLVRNASKQQLELTRAHESATHHRWLFQNVADNLPIGFYTYRDGDFGSSNAEWDRQMGCTSPEDRMGSCRRAVHPEDLEGLLEALREGQRGVSAVERQFRMAGDDREMRSYETRAVPIRGIDGELEHLLGFVVDVTAHEHANRLLADRSRELQQSNGRLMQAYDDLEDNFEAMVRSLVKVVEAKDPYTAGHSERVMEYSMRVGMRLNLSSAEMRTLQIGTLIHDIGKIGIPDAVLLKPDRLTEEEFAVVKLHPEIGARMVQGIPAFQECVPIILHHHERLDGSGYPTGISGGAIPLLVRITAVADAFDAMTSNRAYRRAKGGWDALEELRQDVERGRLDPEIVAIFADTVKEEGVLWSQTRDQAA